MLNCRIEVLKYALGKPWQVGNGLNVHLIDHVKELQDN